MTFMTSMTSFGQSRWHMHMHIYRAPTRSISATTTCIRIHVLVSTTTAVYWYPISMHDRDTSHDEIRRGRLRKRSLCGYNH